MAQCFKKFLCCSLSTTVVVIATLYLIFCLVELIFDATLISNMKRTASDMIFNDTDNVFTNTDTLIWSKFRDYSQVLFSGASLWIIIHLVLTGLIIIMTMILFGAVAFSNPLLVKSWLFGSVLQFFYTYAVLIYYIHRITNDVMRIIIVVLVCIALGWILCIVIVYSFVQHIDQTRRVHPTNDEDEIETRNIRTEQNPTSSRTQQTDQEAEILEMRQTLNQILMKLNSTPSAPPPPPPVNPAYQGFSQYPTDYEQQLSRPFHLPPL